MNLPGEQTFWETHQWHVQANTDLTQPKESLVSRICRRHGLIVARVTSSTGVAHSASTPPIDIGYLSADYTTSVVCRGIIRSIY